MDKTCSRPIFLLIFIVFCVIMPRRDVAAVADYDTPALNSFSGSVGRSRRFDAALRYIGLGKRKRPPPFRDWIGPKMS
uniref:Uncharacterized protein n=1 Tax=Globodera rostochiensis TaxID=31243 RepID=A0A914I9I7_GLORO